MPSQDSSEAPSGDPPGSSPTESRRGFTRRDVLVGALATGTLSAAGTWLTPGGRTPADVTINFVTGAEPSGALGLLVDMWNRANPRAQVNKMEKGGEFTRDQRNAMINEVRKRNADVLNLDVINIPYFARCGYIVRAELADAQVFLPATLASSRILPSGASATPDPSGAEAAPSDSPGFWAVPFNTDVGMLYERVRAAAPPRDDDLPPLKQVLGGLVADGSRQFAGQLNPAVSTAREPFVVNVLEHALSQDPDILDADTGMPSLVVGRWQAALEPLRSAIAKGRVARTTTESATRDAFSRDQLTYMRNWPAEFRRLQQNGDRDSQTLRIRVGVLPNGILGGGSLAIPANARHPGPAAEFVRFLTGDEAQRIIASYGLAPARSSAYADGTLLPFIPHLFKVREAVENARPRPITPGYPEFSDAVVPHFTKFLGGTDLSTAFVEDMQRTIAVKGSCD